MNTAEKNIPDLRFSEFEGEWKQCRLDELAKIERGRFSPRPRNNPIYYGGSIPFVQTGDVVHSNGIIKTYSQTLNEKGLAVSKLFLKGTILITIAANIGYAGILSEDMACPDSLIGITCKEGTKNSFLNILFHLHQPKMDYLAVAAAQKNINIEFLKPYKLIVPELKEQKKIANFLTAIDQRITSLKQKKAALEQYKKGLMQEIFSQEVRFKDDEGNDFSDWKWKKLGEIAKIERGKFSPRPRNNPIYYGGEIPFVQTGDVVHSGGLISTYSQTLNEKGLKVSKLFKEGTILITIAANIGYAGILQVDMACPDSLIGITCKEKTLNTFLNILFQIHQPRMDYLAVAAAQKNINIEFLKPYKLVLPEKKEQQKIANFLSATDKKITAMEKQISDSELFKKGLLQRMFV